MSKAKKFFWTFLVIVVISGGAWALKASSGQEETEEVLRKIVSGNWSRDEFSRVFAGRQRVHAEYAKVRELIAKGNHKEATLLIDELIPLADNLSRAQLLELKRSIQSQRSTP